MAEKSFSVKEIQVQGNGTPTIESPSGGNLNITASTTTFSGTIVASQIRQEHSGNPSIVHLGTGGRVGILQTSPGSALEVKGGIRSAQTPASGHIDLKHDGTNGSITTTSGHFLFYNTSSSGDYIFHATSSNTVRLTIFENGKLRSPATYSGTTTGGSPVYVESDGDLLRYTSSRKYKTDIETLEDARADKILNCRPVKYKSKCENDVKTKGSDKSDWTWYGFIAEEVAEIEPRLVNWATKDAVNQKTENGNIKQVSVERDPSNYEAEGVRYDNFVPLLVNLAKRQKEEIELLKKRVAALEGS
tara:strand:- start:25 stop:933 length:909 start_codon:yes stop_codon:yes gene_type:complete